MEPWWSIFLPVEIAVDGGSVLLRVAAYSSLIGVWNPGKLSPQGWPQRQVAAILVCFENGWLNYSTV